MKKQERIVIATRGSQLALWQANHVKAQLEAIAPGLVVELSIIKTSGDAIVDIPLAKIGGKGLFVKEIEQALLDHKADLAVHSLKDVPGELAPGLTLAAVSVREKPWDVLCSKRGEMLDDLPEGARVGTSSMRRQCQLLARRPDLKILPMRGNVPTRLARLDGGGLDAVVLAAAGLIRLGLSSRISHELGVETCIPAVAQGVLAIEARRDDERAIELAHEAIHDAPTSLKMDAERAFLVAMGGSCQTPLAAHALELPDGRMRVMGMCGMPDGSRLLRAELVGERIYGQVLGERLAADLIAQGAGDILDATRDAGA